MFSLKQFETLGKIQKLLIAMGQKMEKTFGGSATMEKKCGNVSNGGEVCKSLQRWRRSLQKSARKKRLVVLRVLRRSGLGGKFFQVIGLSFRKKTKNFENGVESICTFQYCMEEIAIILFKRSAVDDKVFAGVCFTNCNGRSRSMRAIILIKQDPFEHRRMMLYRILKNARRVSIVDISANVECQGFENDGF